MKKQSIFTLLFLGLIIACRKENDQIIQPIATDKTESLSLAQVKDWYSLQNQVSQLSVNGTLKAFSLKKLSFDWNKAESIPGKKNNYWLIALPGQPIYQNVKQGYRKMAFIRDSTGQINARILEIIPDAMYYQRMQKAETKDFTGRVFIYNEQYKLLGGKIYAKGKQVGQIEPKTSTTANTTRLQTNMMQVVANCAWYDSSYIDAEGIFTIHSEQICSYVMYDDGFYPDMGSGGGGDSQLTQDPLGGGGGGGGEASSAPDVANLPGELNPKIDPKTYMNCFGSLPDIGSKMTITVYVQEPQPGLPFNIGQNSVGHTAIGLTKTYNGQSITQVVGYYPDATGAAKLYAPSKVSDNSDLPYTVSITYPIIASDFNRIVNFIANPPGTYDLTQYNCTNFVYDACKSGGITLPDPTGNVGLMQTGMIPGALGNSIRDVGSVMDTNTSGGQVNPTHGPCN